MNNKTLGSLRVYQIKIPPTEKVVSREEYLAIYRSRHPEYFSPQYTGMWIESIHYTVAT